MENLEALVDKMVEIVESPENKANRKWWKEVQPWPRDFWRGVPAAVDDNATPFLIVPMNEFWAGLFNQDFHAYYHDPLKHLELQLRANIYVWEHLRDDRYFEPTVYIWMGVVTDLSFYDLPIRYFPNREPWIDGPSRLSDKSAFDRMKPPDFHTSGYMPRLREFYGRLQDVLKGRLRVMFPHWVRGPMCHAMHLRGMENLIIDMVDDPRFVYRLMRFVTDARKHWFTEWAKFTGEPVPKAMFYNDEIDVPTLSPPMYRDFVLPYEKEIVEFQGGIVYWHSCGKTTAIMPDIAKLPGLELMHVSPWADISTAVSAFPVSTALDIDLDPVKDMYEADEKKMRQRIKDIRKAAAGRRFSIRADGLQVMGDVRKNLEKIETWVRAAREETRA